MQLLLLPSEEGWEISDDAHLKINGFPANFEFTGKT